MTKNIFRSVSLVVCLSLILSSVPWSPPIGLAADAPEDSSAHPVSHAMEMSGNPSSLLWSPPATSPLVEVARHQVAEQAARPEPEPVDTGEPLLPGTVAADENAPSQPRRTYLPLVLSGYRPKPRDIALSPDTWMAATADWAIYGHNGILVRYPPTWQVTNLSLEEGSAGFRITHNGKIIRVIEEYNQTAPIRGESHPEIAHYRQSGYAIEEIIVKGLPSWEVNPTSFINGLCKEVIVALPETWMRFQLESDGDNLQSCQDQEVFDLVVSSLQLRMGAPSPIEPSDLPDSGQGTLAITGMNYDRQAAYDYCVQYWNDGNSDGEDLDPLDGAHYIAHALCAGGFPIHWCADPQQDHDDSRVINIASQRSYVKGFDDVSSISCSGLQVGDVIYIA